MRNSLITIGVVIVGVGVGDGDGEGLGVGVGDGGGDCTVVVATAVLLEELGSDVVEPAIAVLSIVEPAAPLTVATSVMVSAAPAARDEKVTVRLLPAPPHTPAPVEAQETKVTVAGRLSVTKTDCAVAGPRLLTAMV